MSLYDSLVDLVHQVAGVLQPAHGGTGSVYGEQRVVQRCLNSTGADLPLNTLVEFTFGPGRKVRKVTAANAATVLGVVVGYFDGFGLIEDDAPDGYETAVQTAGIADILIETTVTAGEYAFSAATDGEITSSSTVGTGAFGLVLQSRDTSAGHTVAPVYFPITASGSSGGATFGTPSLTLSTTNGAGSGTNAIRTNATIAAFDATAPVTQAAGDTAAAGTAGVAARRDHKHGMPSTYAPAGHHTSHEAGGSDAIKLDDLAAPDDNTDLNASTSAHGLLKKLDNDTSHFLRGDGSWSAPAGYSGSGLVPNDGPWWAPWAGPASPDAANAEFSGSQLAGMTRVYNSGSPKGSWTEKYSTASYMTSATMGNPDMDVYAQSRTMSVGDYVEIAGISVGDNFLGLVVGFADGTTYNNSGSHVVAAYMTNPLSGNTAKSRLLMNKWDGYNTRTSDGTTLDIEVPSDIIRGLRCKYEASNTWGIYVSWDGVNWRAISTTYAATMTPTYVIFGAASLGATTNGVVGIQYFRVNG